MPGNAPGVEPIAIAAPGRGRQLFRNTALQIGGKGGAAAIGLFLTPFILSRIGVVQYGLWAFVLSTVTYATVLDPGVGAMVYRYTAWHQAHDDLDPVGSIIAFGVLIYVALGVLLLPLALYLVPLLVGHLHFPHALNRTATQAFYLGYGYIFTVFIVAVLANALAGMGDLGKASMIDLASRGGYSIVVVALMLRGVGLFGLIAATYIQALISVVALFVACRRRFGRVFRSPLLLKGGKARELLSFGGWVQATTVFNFIARETDPLVIGTFISVADVGIYSIASSIAVQVGFLPLSFTTALLHPATLAHEAGDKEALKTIIVSGGRGFGLCTVAIAGLLIATEPVIFRAWLGRTYPRIDVIMALVLLAYTITSLSSVARSVVHAIGRPGMETRNVALGAILNVIATVALAIPFGVVGVLIGTLIGTIAQSVAFQWRFHREMHLPWWEAVGSWLWRAVLAVAGAAGFTRLVIAVLPQAWSSSRSGAISVLFCGFVFYLTGLFVAVRVARLITSKDLDKLASVLPHQIARLVPWKLLRLAA